MKVIRTLKYLLLVPVMGLLMGGEGPGCTYSQHPLSEMGDGFIDSDLIGRWYRVEMGDDESEPFEVGELSYDVSIDVTGDFLLIKKFVDDEDEGEHSIHMYAGHSSRLGDTTFLNSRYLDCMGCLSEESVELNRSSSCPYQIIKYRANLTYEDLLEVLPEDADADDEEEADEYAAFRNRVREMWPPLQGYTLQVWLSMDTDFIEEAIELGLIEGSTECDSDCAYGACIEAEPQTLRSFVAEHHEEAFSKDFYFELLAKKIEQSN